MSPQFKPRATESPVRVILASALWLAVSLQPGAEPPLAGRQGAPQVAALKSTAAISGVVVDAATQAPVAGAIVMLLGAAPPPGSQAARTSINPSGQSVTVSTPLESFAGVRQITDDRGRFVFTDLPAMSYLLEASKFGYLDGVYGRRATPDGVRGSARRIDLSDAEWLRDTRVELAKPCAINGSVVDETGEALVGVAVRAYAEIYVGGVRQLGSAAGDTTDDRGAYRIANLAPGRYIIAVPSVQHAVPAGTTELLLSNATKEAVAAAEAAGRDSPLRRDPVFAVDPAYRLVVMGNSPLPPPSAAGHPQFYPTTFYPASRAIADASMIALQAGDDRSAVDLQLSPMPAFRISGRVEGPADTIGGLSLRLMGAGTESLGRGAESATALTAPDGSFTFLNVADGTYTVIASRSVAEYAVRSGTSAGPEPPSPPGFGATSSSSTALDSGPSGTEFRRYAAAGNPRFSGRRPVSVSGRDMTGLVVPLQAGVAITGQIVFEFESDISKRQPLIQLRAEPANADPNLGLGQPSLMRGPNEFSWDFRFEGLMAGAYLLRAGFGGIKSITWHGQDYTDIPFEGSAGQDFTGVIVTVTDKSTTLSGTVLDRTGQPAANAAVIAFPAEPALWSNYGLQPPRLRASSGSTSGTYLLRGLPAGNYLLVAVDDRQIDRRKNPAFLEAASRLAARVSIAWGETKTQQLTLQEIK